MEGLSEQSTETKTPFQLDREQYEVGDVRYRITTSDLPLRLPDGEPVGLHVEIWQDTANEFNGWSVIGRSIKVTKLFEQLETRDRLRGSELDSLSSGSETDSYLPPYEANWLEWFQQMDRISVHSPDDPMAAWANEASGGPRWTVWSWCGGSGGPTAWCDTEGAARLIADALETVINSKPDRTS